MLFLFFFSFFLSLYLYSHGFYLHLLSGGKKHVTAVSDPVPGLSPGRPGDPSAGSADQGERPGAHRCRGTHVHQQPGDPHQVPRLKVRPAPSSAWLSLSLSLTHSSVLEVNFVIFVRIINKDIFKEFLLFCIFLNVMFKSFSLTFFFFITLNPNEI